MLGQIKSFEPPPSQATSTDFGNLLTVAEGKNINLFFQPFIHVKDFTWLVAEIMLDPFIVDFVHASTFLHVRVEVGIQSMLYY